MDNQDSSPQLVFPSVPDDFCPSGNWTEILQAFIDEVLANGTINVPGLGDVTPQQIQTINNQLASQQNEISSLDTRVDALEPAIKVRTGVITIGGAGPLTLNISFAALPSADYGVALQPIGTATAAAAGKYILQAGQTTTGFTVLVDNNPPTVTQLRWTAIHTA